MLFNKLNLFKNLILKIINQNNKKVEENERIH